MNISRFAACAACVLGASVSGAGEPAPDAPLRERAAEGLRRAAAFMRDTVAVEGSYLWQYTGDLALREGEGVATDKQGWVQPPGTPSVGMAFLQAWDATGDSYYLKAARDTANGLVRGQLRSGGWNYKIEFDPAARATYAYRADAPASDAGNAGKIRNVTTFDDDTTQAALRFLMRVDEALAFRDARIHEAVCYGLDAALKAQYPNGAWPQRYDVFPDPARCSVKPAAYPAAWSRRWPKVDYRLCYTLNDNLVYDMVRTLGDAARIYAGAEAASADSAAVTLAGRCRAALAKAGDFLRLAQMPEPQPAWAQQYDADMHPAWARKFEPPAVTGGESHSAMKTLLLVYRETGDAKYLAPIPRALAYLRRSRLPDGRLARFYELRTNKPLYFTHDYALTYDDDDVPTHYSFKVGDGTDAIEREYARVKAMTDDERRASLEPDHARPRPDAKLEKSVSAVLAAMDARGAWVEDGKLKYHKERTETIPVIKCATFAHNVAILSRYLAATRPVAYFPPPESAGGWRTLSAPADIRSKAGMNPAALDSLAEWLRASDERDFAAVVVRRGYLVLQVERGRSAADSTENVKSCAKAICATVLAIASEESGWGRTPRRMTFDDFAFEFIPWAKPLSDPRKAAITVRQLLNHTSGITPESTGAPNRGPWEWILGHTGDPKTATLAFAPGTDLDYSTHAIYHAALVCENVTGRPYDEYAIERLLKPLGIEKWWFEYLDGDDAHGRHASHTAGLPARALARIAYCMAHEGRWNNTQLVPNWFVDETAAPTHAVTGIKTFDRDAESWSHGWELPARLSGGRGEGIPADARFKPGSGGQLIAFVPSLDLVIARQTGGSGPWEYEDCLRRACAAVELAR